MTNKKNRRVLDWVKTKGKNLVGKGLDIFGEFTGKEAIEKLGEMIQDDPELSIEDKAEAAEIVQAELRIFELANNDRDSARKREVELAKAGRKDWLMYVTGLTALFSFLVILYAVIWIPETKDNPLAIHLMGIVEGVVLSLFFYYFGSSKGSKDKTDILSKK